MNCEVVFFPNKANEQKIIDFINEAKKELKVCVFTFTNQNIAMAILNKVIKDNVKVRIITDDEQNAGVYSIVNVLQSASDDLIKFRTDLRKDAHMHHKYVVIDDKLIATGSFNWTQAAVLKNNENLLLIRDPKLAKQYSQNFEELWEEFKATELSISQITAVHKEKGKALISKANAGPKPEKKPSNRGKKGKLILPPSDQEEEAEEKPKRSRRPAITKAPQPSENNQDQQITEERIENSEEKKSNEGEIDNAAAANEPQQLKEKAKKLKRIRKLQKSLQQKRQISQIYSQQKKSRTIKSIFQNVLSFTLGAALTVGSYACYTQNFSQLW